MDLTKPLDEHSAAVFKLARAWLEDEKNTGSFVIDICILETVCRFHHCVTPNKDRNELFNELLPIFGMQRSHIIMQLRSALSKADGDTYKPYKLYLAALKYAEIQSAVD